MQKICLGAVSLCFAVTLFAEENSSDLSVTGYIDGSYNYLLRDNKFISGVYDRVYDITPNGITLQQAAMTFAYQPKEGFGGVLNPIIGRDTYNFSPYGWSPNFGYQWFGFDFAQAYLQYASGPFTIVGGELFSLPTAESTMPIKDTNFSRSILFGYATPATVFGFRGNYAFSDQFTLIVGLNDGWDTIRDFGRGPTLELSASYTPFSAFSLAATSYIGNQRAADRTSTGPDSVRKLIDVVVTWNATNNLTFITNYDYGTQPKALLASGNIGEAVWQGIAGYINYKFDDQWRTSLRGEIFSDRNGYRTGVEQCWKELTLTLGYSPIKNLEFRAETRHDFSNVDSFIDKDEDGLNNNQQSFALEVLYQFRSI